MNVSFTKSEQITDSLRRSFKNVDCKMANRVCYGYTVSSEGELCINEAEAKTIRWIFERYLVGNSLGKIAASLKQKGVVSPSGKAAWNREAISKILSNEKYVGSVLLQKTASICGAQFANAGEVEKVLIKNHHAAIISPEQFAQVQELKQTRAKHPCQIVTMQISY